VAGFSPLALNIFIEIAEGKTVYKVIANLVRRKYTRTTCPFQKTRKGRTKVLNSGSQLTKTK